MIISALFRAAAFTAAITLTGIAAVSPAYAQAAQMLAETERANREIAASLQEWKATLQSLMNSLGKTGCDCAVNLGACQATASLVPENERSTLTIDVASEKRQCFRVSVFITTQWDLDNNTPIDEQITVFEGNHHEEWIDNSDWNGRQPLLQSGVTCQVCEDGAAKFCREAPDTISEFSKLAPAYRDASAQFAAILPQLSKTVGNPQIASALKQQAGLMKEAQVFLDDALPQLQRSEAAHCQ